jgi:AcrR family transcriptional regulator
MSHRERLLVAARHCLVTQGYARTTARDLVAASDTNLGSIGYHFGSKDTLLDLALQQAQVEYVEKVLAVATAAGESTGGLEAVKASWIEMVAAFGEMRELTIAFFEALVQGERSPELRAGLAATSRQMRDTIRTTLDRADVGDPARRGAIASYMMAVCDGLLVQWLLDPDAIPDGEELFEAARSVFAV